jgi:hypothetical protein
MTIALQASSTVNAATGSMLTHAAGDLLLWFAYRDNSATVPTIPSGWVTRVSLSQSLGSLAIAYKYAQSNSESYGTWTNATQIFASVWRGDPNTLIFPNYLSTNNATSTTISYLSQTANTFQTNASDQALVGWVANRNSANTLSSPSGMTLAQSATDGSAWQTRLDYQLSRTTIWPSTNVAVTNSAAWRTFVLSLVESPVYGISGGGGSVRQVNIRGGADQ